MQPCAGAWCRRRDRLRPSLHAQARKSFRPDGARSDRLQSARRPRKRAMFIHLRLPEKYHLHRRFQPATNRACSQVRHRMFPQACGHSRGKSKFLKPLVALFNRSAAITPSTLPPKRDTNTAVPHLLPRLRGPCRGLVDAELPDTARAIGLTHGAN